MEVDLNVLQIKCTNARGKVGNSYAKAVLQILGVLHYGLIEELSSEKVIVANRSHK